MSEDRDGIASFHIGMSKVITALLVVNVKCQAHSSPQALVGDTKEQHEAVFSTKSSKEEQIEMVPLPHSSPTQVAGLSSVSPSSRPQRRLSRRSLSFSQPGSR